MRKFIIPIIIICLGILFSSIFVVQEGTKNMVLRFGKVTRDAQELPIVYEPGIYFKLPFVDRVKVLDARIQTMKTQADRFVTKEKKDLIVDSYLQWRIIDFPLYYLATGGGDISQAETLLRRKYSDRLRSEIGRLDIKDIVRDSRGRLMVDVRNALNNGTGDDTSVDPMVADVIANVHDKKLANINLNSMAALGIQVVDVRIKQINLPVEISGAIFERMQAERKAVASRHRAQGMHEAQKVRAKADYEATKIIAEAEREVRTTRGQGDAIVAKLYADAFSKEPEFFSFVRSLRAYEISFSGGHNVMVLSPKSDFFHYMGLSKSKE